ncbi:MULTISPECIES: ATP-binding protein [unclassified Tolypothrix]|uniref:ATP-binding protein n=1 Tax=unclassified Tolypothrix TaxID=2649714 RepID=UPI0005EABCF9|nr:MULTISPECIES: ATP-binding protein [unclassified Tolypothrix]BAY89125.1 PAS/PAC sensor signal transduction histidine kinase [Microchaete diplosiphon NIES-3275]EKE96863.1 ATPase, histidine kinase-, DNA gyrase B-, and HSP90-like domain protein [Tolypothrix sp. PCC 7601]MBE9084462.1 two-component sensor histidine kinase [Tolypothrix sp. LEGE 11397]UYD29743.1 two-component sensor histidine kinase [Tolypothrix sp. PCC 7712]UYD34341.1 two-component sensor histidine kinase [Tolypothrix sp. PCC 7601
METTDNESRLKELEKTVRILKKKLERSEADRQQLENNTEVRESVLKNMIRELEESQTALKHRGDELENAFKNLEALQMKLVESEKMSALGVLVAGIAHEINNPVSFIYGNLTYAYEYFQNLLNLISLYQKYYPEPEVEIQQEIQVIEFDFLKQDVEKLFRSMNVGAERIREIVKSLRTFSRLDEAEFKAVDIHEGIDSTLVILNSRLKASADNYLGIEVIKNYGKLPLIKCYAGHMNQVFMNLMTNAIDALEDSLLKQEVSKQLKLHITTKNIDNSYIEIRIADNGIGMEDKVRNKVFDPFFTTKAVGKGTGLGLSISYQIVNELHGGKLECYSQPCVGTEFVIQIPIRDN